MNYTIQKNWIIRFREELSNVDSISIISPFVSKGMVDDLINHIDNKKIKLITRFNLNDFFSGVSSLSALEKLVKLNVEIHGIKDLHSKVYLFGNRSVIIGSANFTNGGFYSNYEFGVYSNDNDIIVQSENYFGKLWTESPQPLTIDLIYQWQQILEACAKANKKSDLPDFGKSVVANPNKVNANQNVFIKFFGKSNYRADLNYTAKNEIERSHCHWALTFSGKRGRYSNGRPRKYKDGDIVYMARMLEGNDYAIFGKGIALKHIDSRDVASKEDIDKISWKKDWPVYIRVKDVVFIDTTMKNCPKLSDLINELKFQSFPTTLVMHQNGQKNINPRLSLKQKADILLTTISAEWLDTKFQETINRNGSVSQDYLDSLYPGTPSLDEIL